MKYGLTVLGVLAFFYFSTVFSDSATQFQKIAAHSLEAAPPVSGDGRLEEEERLPMVGLDAEGRPLETSVPLNTLSKNLMQLALLAEATSEASLAKLPVAGTWSLKQILVGVGVRIKIGWDKIINADLVPGFRLIWSRSDDGTPALSDGRVQ